MDGNSIALLSAGIGAVGVLATLLAPRISRVARLFVVVSSVSKINPSVPNESLTIQFKHAGKIIKGSFYSINVLIENTGKKDITKTDFINPVEIEFKDEINVLSAQVNSESGIFPKVNIGQNGVHVEWDILKERESIELVIIANTEADIKADDFYGKYIKILTRLKDVRVGDQPRFLRKILTGIAAGFGLLFVFAVVSIISNIPHRNDLLIYKDPIGSARFLTIAVDPWSLAPGNYVTCQYNNSIFYVSECKKVDVNEFKRLSQEAKTGSGRLGTPKALTILFIIFSVFYGIFTPILPTMVSWIQPILQVNNRRIRRGRRIGD